jgi:hypothetical protein
MSDESAPGQPQPVVGAVPLAQLKSVVLKNIDACVLLWLSKQYDAIQKKPEGKIEEKTESAGKRGRKQNRESAGSEQELEIETDPRAPHRWSGEPVYGVSLADDQVRVVTEAVDIEESTAFHVPLTFINTFEAPGNAPALAFYGDDQTVLRYPATEIFRVKAKAPEGAASSGGKRKEPETFEGWVRLEQFDVFPEAALAAFYKREASELLTAISKFPHRESVTNQLIVGVVAKVAVEGSGAARMIGRNYAFLGPPGTGKTQFASWTARLFFLLGVVDVGHTVMASAATLIPGFEGQATRATARALSLARGGMLFVDEAYSLGDDKMGQQALTQLVAATGGAPQHQPMIVIVAGYERAMDEHFFARNRGLKDRFTVVSFPSYSRDQLYDLLEREVAAVNEAIAEANGWPKNHCRYNWAPILMHDVKLLFPHNSRTDDDNDNDSDKDGDDSDSDRDGDGEGEDDDNGGDENDNAVDITDDNGDAVDINDDSDDAVDINDDNDDGDDQFGNMRFIKQLVRQAHDRAARRVCAAQSFEIDTQKPILVEVADLQDSVNPTLLADTVCPKVDAVLQKALISAAKQEGRMSIVMSALAHMWRPDDRELSAESSTYRYGHLRVPKKPKNVIDMIALRQARYLRHFNGIAAIMVSKRDGDHVYIMANDAYELGFRVTKKRGCAAGWKKWLSAKLPVGAVTYPVLSILLKDKELEAFKATLPQPNSAKSVRLYAALALLQSIENEFGLSDEPDLYFDEDMVNAVPLILELHKRGVRKEFAESAAVQLSMLSQSASDRRGTGARQGLA